MHVESPELTKQFEKEHSCRFSSPASLGTQRRWHDGSLENDLPFRQLAEMFNVNHFIVSQTNPHLVPLMTLKNVVPGPIFNMVQAEVKHAFAQVRYKARLVLLGGCS